MKRREFELFLKTCDYRNVKSVEKAIDVFDFSLLELKDIYSYSLNALREWVVLSLSGEHISLTDTVVKIQMLLYFSSLIDINTGKILKQNKLDVLSLSVSDSCFDQSVIPSLETFDDRVSRICKGDVNTVNLPSEYKLLLSGFGCQVFEHENKNLLIVFEVWHPQRDKLNFIYFDVEMLKCYIPSNVLSSLAGGAGKVDYFSTAGKLLTDSFLRSKFYIKENSICLGNNIPTFFLYGSNHFGHFILNIFSQIHRLINLLSNKEGFSCREVLVLVYWTGGHKPDFINLAREYKLENFNLRVVNFNDFKISIRNYYLPLGLCGCKIENDFGSFARGIILRKDNKKNVRIGRVGSLKLALGLRSGSRSLINQKDAFVRLVLNLSLYYSSLQIVIDGMFASSSANISSTLMLDAQEELNVAKELVFELNKKLDNKLSIVNLAGLSFSDQIYYLSACDFVVAPLGSGFAKYQWISDIPGIAFGPKNAIYSFNQHANQLTEGVGLNFNSAYKDITRIKAKHGVLPISCVSSDSDENYRGNFALKDDAIDLLTSIIIATNN